MSDILRKFLLMLEETDKNDLCGIMPCDNNCMACPVGRKENIDEVIKEIRDASDMRER